MWGGMTDNWKMNLYTSYVTKKRLIECVQRDIKHDCYRQSRYALKSFFWRVDIGCLRSHVALLPGIQFRRCVVCHPHTFT